MKGIRAEKERVLYQEPIDVAGWSCVLAKLVAIQHLRMLDARRGDRYGRWTMDDSECPHRLM